MICPLGSMIALGRLPVCPGMATSPVLFDTGVAGITDAAGCCDEVLNVTVKIVYVMMKFYNGVKQRPL